MFRLLYIGTFPPPAEGGVRLGVQTLANELKERDDVVLDIVDISKNGGVITRLWFFIRKFWNVIWRARASDLIVFSAPTSYTPLFGGVLFLISRLSSRPLVLRHSAGHNDLLYLRMNALGRWWMRNTVFAAELNLYQTKPQVEFFKSVCTGQVMLFPNHRKPPKELERRSSRVAKRFVFIGRVEVAKGADILIDAFDSISIDAELDLYGKDLIDVAEKIESLDHVSYRGTFDHGQVFEVLKQYDALILPSTYEGQPGVIVESFLAGLPVIATTIPGIQDIVQDGVNGLLFPSGDRDELKKAIELLGSDETVYRRLAENVWDTKDQFSSGFWSKLFHERCLSLISN